MENKELVEKIESLKPWISYFELAPGITTLEKPDWRVYRGKMFMQVLSDIFGGSLKDKSVFDIGCNAGGFSFDALENGAKFCQGIDGRPNYVEQADFLKGHFSYTDDQAKFTVSDLYDATAERFGKYNLTLFCGVLYYLTKPLDVFRNLSEMTEDVIFVDTHTNMKNDISMNILSVDPERPMVGLETLGFYPSVRGCVKMMQNVGFSEVVLVDMVKLIPRFFSKKDASHSQHKDWAFEYHRGLRVTLIGFKNKALFEDYVRNHGDLVLKAFRSTDKSLLPLHLRVMHKAIRTAKQLRYKIHKIFMH